MIWQNQNVFPLLIVNAATGPTGFFVYSPVPGKGNLVYSVTENTVDPYGNATVAGGAVSYNDAAGLALSQSGAAMTFFTGHLASAWTAQATIIGDTLGDLALSGGGTGVIQHLSAASFTGGNVTVSGNVLRLVAGAVELLTDTGFPAAVAGTSQLLSSSGGLATVYGSGQQARLSTGRVAAVTPVTVTQAAFTSLFNGTILGGEAIVGATYEASAFGFGAWGATAQDLFFGIRFGATDATTIGTTVDINSAAFALNALFRWDATATLTCVTTGATAHWVANIKGCVTQTANSILPGTAGTNTVPFSGGTGSGTVTLDSTVNEIFGISAHWTATTGAPTITASQGIMKRTA